MDKKIIGISLAFGVILMNMLSMSNIFALLDKDGRYAIVTVQNVKSKDIEIYVYVYD